MVCIMGGDWLPGEHLRSPCRTANASTGPEPPPERQLGRFPVQQPLRRRARPARTGRPANATRCAGRPWKPAASASIPARTLLPGHAPPSQVLRCFFAGWYWPA